MQCFVNVASAVQQLEPIGAKYVRVSCKHRALYAVGLDMRTALHR